MLFVLQVVGALLVMAGICLFALMGHYLYKARIASNMWRTNIRVWERDSHSKFCSFLWVRKMYICFYDLSTFNINQQWTHALLHHCIICYHFHAVFGKNMSNNRLAPPLQGCRLLGNPGSATVSCIFTAGINYNICYIKTTGKFTNICVQ